MAVIQRAASNLNNVSGMDDVFAACRHNGHSIHFSALGLMGGRRTVRQSACAVRCAAAVKRLGKDVLGDPKARHGVAFAHGRNDVRRDHI